ncbi:uncharacterized protein LOC143528822 isoform X2 [Brachyhypopomus gauderio]|uniref:uncharacterized protein LOC143528822 isoform X2 n=1 Tax=Brachyhypopomus gauderio TaxID=698409 RepID=UPI0040423ED6
MATTVNMDTFLHPPLGENLSRLSLMPLWAGHQRHGPEKTYETTFQKDFQSFPSLTKRAAVPRPATAEVEHRDLRRIKEYETEVARSFSSHPTAPLSRIQAWTKLVTNLKTHSDQRFQDFRTIHSESFRHPPASSAVSSPVHPALAVKVKQRKDELPDTTHRASYVAHKVSPVLKAKCLGGRGPITGDNKLTSVSTSYNDTFQYKESSPAQCMEKQIHSSLAMGDREKVQETKTTHTASFKHKGVQRPLSLKKSLHLNLGDLQNKWTTTTSDAFNEIKSDPVHLQPRKTTQSSVPQGDTDVRRNQDRMTSTTNRFFFSEARHRQFPVRVDGPSIRTKSNVKLGTSLSGTVYSTTAQESYTQKSLARAKPQTYPPGWVLANQESGPALSTVQQDYIPVNSRRHGLSPGNLAKIKESHIKPPHSEQYFTTTHREAFEVKPIPEVPLDHHRRHTYSLPSGQGHCV